MAETQEDIIPTHDEIVQAVKNDVGNEAKVLSFKLRPASESPMGFLGDHLRVKVDIEQGREKKIAEYFVKLIPTKFQAHRDYAEKTRAFFKEIEMYKTLFDDIQNAQSPARRHLKWRPDCYFTRDYNLVLVEDLSVKGYYMLPERTRMGLEYVKETVRTLARMNAGTLIFEAKFNNGKATSHSKLFSPGGSPRTVRDLYPDLIFESECIVEPGHPGTKFWETGIQSELAVIDILPGYSQEEKERIKERFPDAMRQVFEMTLPSPKYKNIMTHGDIWGNNILFKNGPDGKLADAIFVDFQMARYAPPAQDLLLSLHVIQSRTFREEYEKSLVDLYYQCLASELEAEGLNVEDIVPRAEFDESLKYYKSFAIITNVIYTQLNQTPPDVCAKFLATPELYNKVMFEDRSEMLVTAFTCDDLTKEKTLEVLQEMIEHFKLNS